MAVRTIDREAVRAWRPRSGGRLVAPDGSTLTVKHADSARLIEPWFTENRVRFSGNSPRRATSGDARSKPARQALWTVMSRCC